MTRPPLRLVAIVLALSASRAAGQNPPVDPYLCYRVQPTEGSAPFASLQKSLQDAQPPARPYALRKVVSLCNPASVAGGSVTDFIDHEVAYKVRALKGSPGFARRTVEASDALGLHALAIRRPDTLLVPSSKVLGSGGAPPYGPPNVRHYLCYRARQSGFVPPPAMTVLDQFRFTSYELRKPTRLCAPVDKDGEDPSAPADPTHLVCYRVRGPKLARTAVSTNNQIRPETLDAVRPIELCLPAFVAPTGSTTSTPTTTITIPTTTVGPPTTSTTFPVRPCGDPQSPSFPVCWGECPAATPICIAGASGCECAAGTTPCGEADFPACDGACGAGEACVVSPTLGCTCQFQGFPCAASFAFTGTCGGVCGDGSTCAGPFFTPDGNGCACVPIGSTCHITCGADPGAGNCPPGQSCGQLFPGFCGCG